MEDYGLKIPDLIAGLMGGLAASFVMRQSDPWTIIGSIIVGALTANYFGEHVSDWVGQKLTREAADFLLGLTAMSLCQTIIDRVKTLKVFKNGA